MLKNMAAFCTLSVNPDPTLIKRFIGKMGFDYNTSQIPFGSQKLPGGHFIIKPGK